MPIFESPDNGNTVYAREPGETERKLIRRNESYYDKLEEDKLWGEIRRKAKTHPALHAELDRVIIFYNLIKDNGR